MQLLILPLLLVGLLGTMLAEGLGLDARRLLYVPRRPALLLRSALAVLVLVPVLAFVVIRTLAPQYGVQVGLAVLAASPVAPLALARISRQGGSLDYSASVHLSLAVLSIATTPLVLHVLARALAFPLSVNPLEVAGRVARTVVLPLGAGVLTRAVSARFADRVRRPIARLAGVCLLLAVAVILVAGHRLLLGLNPRSYLAMAIFLAAALAAGHLVARPDPAERTTLALEAATRNPGIALLIAGAVYGRAAALAILLPYLVLNALLGLVYVKARQAAAAARARGEGPAPPQPE